MEDFPGDVMGAADLFTDAHHAVAILIAGALPAPAAVRRFDAVANDFLPEGQSFSPRLKRLGFDDK